MLRSARTLGVRALVVQADVSKQTDVVRLFEEAVNKLGRLDIVFSNSGIEHWGKPDEIDEAQLDKVGVLQDSLHHFLDFRCSIPMSNRNSLSLNKRTNTSTIMVVSFSSRLCLRKSYVIFDPILNLILTMRYLGSSGT